MFELECEVAVNYAHKLNLPYESVCSELHGHCGVITINIQSQKLNESGMVMDFAEVKQRIKKALDHRYLNEIPYFNLGINTTAENIAKYLVEDVFKDVIISRLIVQETPTNKIIYYPEVK